jgi:hypothetical protein
VVPGQRRPVDGDLIVVSGVAFAVGSATQHDAELLVRDVDGRVMVWLAGQMGILGIEAHAAAAGSPRAG